MHTKPSFLFCVWLVLGMKLLTVAFVWFLESGWGWGWKFRPQKAFLATFCSLKIGVLLANYFKEQINMQLKIYLYHPSSQTNGISFSPCTIPPPPTPLGTPKPYHLQGCETFFLKKLKINYVLTNFSLPGIQTLMKINSVWIFHTCESFDAKNSTGTPYACACRPINFKSAGLICRSQVAGRGLQVIVSPIQKVP